MWRSSIFPEPLHHRDFRVFFIGHAASSLGNALTAIALAFAVLEITGSVAALGLVLAATRLPLVVFVLIGGVVGDRLPRQHVMLASDAVRFATQALAGGLLVTHRAELWHLVVLFALHGVAQAFFNPAAAGIAPQLVTGERLHQANALLDVSRNSAAVGGSLLSGVVVGAFGAGAAFLIDSLTFVVSACSLALLRPAGALAARPAGVFIRQLVEGWNEFRSRTWLWVGVVHVALLNAFALVAFFTLGPVVAKDSLGGAYAWGTIASAFAGGMITGGLIAARWRPRRPLVVAFAVIVFAAPQLALLAVAAPATAVAAASFFGGAQASLWGVLWTTTMQEQVPESALSRVAAYGSLGSLILAPIGYAVVGPVAGRFGVDSVLWAGAGWIVLSTLAVIALPSIRAIRSGVPPVETRAAVAG